MLKVRIAEAATEEAAVVERLGQAEAVVPVQPAQQAVQPVPKPVIASRPQTVQDHVSYYLQVGT